MVTPVPGLPQSQACEALNLSRELTDAGIFVLMGCLRLGKSRSERVFSRRSLSNRPSITLPLREAGVDLDEVLGALIRGGFINHAGFGRVQVSEKGVVIEHRYSLLRAYMALRGLLPALGTRFSSIPELRARMKTVCDLGGLPI